MAINNILKSAQQNKTINYMILCININVCVCVYVGKLGMLLQHVQQTLRYKNTEPEAGS